MAAPKVDPVENRRRMEAGELYYAFTRELTADRKRSSLACSRFNKADDVSRRQGVELLKDLLVDQSPLPPRHPNMTDEEDEAQLDDYPMVFGPVVMDYGYNVKLGKNVMVNFGSTWIDTCKISLGARTMVGPNCSFFSGTHPLDPTVRNGTRGPETGKPISIGEDCWFGGNCIVLPGVTIGKGVTVGAGSVVTKDVPDYHCVAGNPARIIKKIEVSGLEAAKTEGAEVLIGEDAPVV
ncbi:hypothetical protein Daus18300_004737 [Diaporthe australafricana]|uniref:Maltose/galactoside acetyltransferase domain-containing protein n=1 Tax=Diaporthe australafricana TaxID=127596 RepID=A0ABR3X603_9PEZI